MISYNNILAQLKSLKNLLLKEKDALVASDAKQVSSILEQKVKVIQSLEGIENIETKNKDKITLLIEEINEIQEVNLLLTKQSLAFQDALLETLSLNMNNLSNTYSNKGKMYESNSEITLVDQSI